MQDTFEKGNNHAVEINFPHIKRIQFNFDLIDLSTKNQGSSCAIILIVLTFLSNVYRTLRSADLRLIL